MVMHAQRTSTRGPERAHGLRLVEPGPPPRLHLFTCVVGNALVWTLLAAVSISADPWYWWPVAPIAAWAVTLAVYLALARRA